TASFFSTLAGVYLPGKDCLLHSAEVSFRKPVYPGTVLTVSGKVQDIREHLNVFTIKVTITNQDGEKVCTGKIRAGIIQIQDKSKEADDPG
ncbi:MAG: MaoC family dehydratase N-terminal domain-containing protein, partial [Eubacterium sp.]|nr:MaoC family dehydratase N-terminal domain-containing protein [Eubacterium sp.]